jgi:hypothetical protein
MTRQAERQIRRRRPRSPQTIDFKNVGRDLPERSEREGWMNGWREIYNLSITQHPEDR